MRVVYLLSDKFDYRQLIAGDAGPAFADDYGWPTAMLSGLRQVEADIVVVDIRLLADELDSLRRAMESSSATFILRICDPFLAENQQHWWYRFVAEMLDAPRTHLMLSYQPSEITALWSTQARRSRFVFAPYVYRSEHERSIDHADRKNCLLVSASRSKRIYPLRARMHNGARLPPLSFISNVLPHPGYPDFGHPPKHDIIGERYLDFLSKFRFATLCSSRCRIEFLKYREFAYAGVVPVGDIPITLYDCPGHSWIPWRRNFVWLALALATDQTSQDRAIAFREFMSSKRGVIKMRTQVNERLSSLL